MTHRQININNWLVDVFIDDGKHFDIDEVLEVLYGMGASFEIMEKAEYMMQGFKPNEAFTFSVWRHTCIYIGWTTSGSEFLNSMKHEIRHLIDHIANAYGIKTNGEEVGYMSGDAAYQLAEDICRFGCEHCRNQETIK